MLQRRTAEQVHAHAPELPRQRLDLRPPRRWRSRLRVRRPLIRDTRREGVVADRVAPDELVVADLVERRRRPCPWRRRRPRWTRCCCRPRGRRGSPRRRAPAGRRCGRTREPRRRPCTMPTDQPPIRAASMPQVVARDPVGDDGDLPGVQRLAPAPQDVLGRPGAHQDEVGTRRDAVGSTAAARWPATATRTTWSAWRRQKSRLGSSARGDQQDPVGAALGALEGLGARLGQHVGPQAGAQLAPAARRRPPRPVRPGCIPTTDTTDGPGPHGRAGGRASLSCSASTAARAG